jgi:multiple sugar transport system permease protein
MIVRWPLVGGNNILGQGGTGFLNTWGSLLITGWVQVYYIFMFRQVLSSIPMDFEEAARVDGANTLQCLFRIYLPMLKPVFVVLFISQFVAIWNDYLWPLMVVASNYKLMPIGLGFQYISMAQGVTRGTPPDLVDYPFAFAVGVVTITPCILLYMFLQRYFIEGVAGFAIKG